MSRDRAHGEGSLVQREDGQWVARILLVTGRKVQRIRRTREDAEAALAEIKVQYRDQLGYHYRLSLDGKPLTMKPPKNPRAGVTAGKRWQVFERDGHKCRYCGWGLPDVRLTVDHVVPIHLGGSHELDNLVTACEECNRGKGRLALVSGL